MPAHSKDESTRILLVEDYLLIREGLRLLLDSQPELKVIGEASSCNEALALVKRERPDVILLDLHLTDSSGLDFLSELPQALQPSNGKTVRGQTNAKSVKAILLIDSGSAEECRRAIVLGANGVVLKSRPSKVLFAAIHRVCEGEVWIDPEVMASILAATSHNSTNEQNTEKARIATLTEREIEVIQLLAEGLKNHQIAKRLFVSEGTVRHYLNRAFTKLGISDRSKLLIYAFRHGIAKPF